MGSLSEIDKNDHPRDQITKRKSGLSVVSTGLVKRGLDDLELLRDSPIRILHVDDIDDTRAAVRKLLDGFGVSKEMTVVAEAADGPEGIAAYEKHGPDVVLTNISMPAMDGLAMSRQILKQDPEAKILYLTVHSGRSVVSKAIPLGAKGFIYKPPGGADLIEAIREVHAEPAESLRFRYPADSISKLYDLPDGLAFDRKIRLLDGWTSVPEGEIIGVRHSSQHDSPARYIDHRFLMSVQEIDLAGTKVENHAAWTLARASSLETLDLRGTPVRDGFLAPLGSLKLLSRLDLSYTEIAPAGLMDLSAFKNMVTLKLGGLSLPVRILGLLSRLPRLRRLHLDGCVVESSGLSHLARAGNLRTLSLVDADLQGDATLHLSRMSGLEYLWLRGTGLDIVDLQRKLPECRISG